MNVSLPATLEEFVRSKIAAGEFHSPDEVVCEGLRLLQQEAAWKADARHKIDSGWEQARAGRLLTPDEVRANLSVRKENWKREHDVE